jgi:hypothetical protein
MIYATIPLLFGDQNWTNEMDGLCGTYGRQERCIQGFGENT